ncbi:hypothetical protein H6G27_26765 [Nostoc linckia FACHB-104]|nr:hypothetical protein [Nostoc linckia FACHB-104]
MRYKLAGFEPVPMKQVSPPSMKVEAVIFTQHSELSTQHFQVSQSREKPTI